MESILKDVKVDDYLWFVNTSSHIPVLRKVVKIDAAGRIFFAFGQDWRQGFDPKTGLAKRKWSGRIKRKATDEEIASYVAKQEAEAKRSKEHEQQRNRPEILDASFILSHTEEQLIAKLTPTELHVLAGQLRK